MTSGSENVPADVPDRERHARPTGPATDLAPFVSVIIPVKDDSLRLALCLEALSRQHYPSSAYEVIVVDNGSTDRPGEVVARFPGVRLLTEPKPAADRARNVGIRAARGEILGFTDSDCLPRPDWLRRGASRVADQDPPGLIAGRIVVTSRPGVRPSLAELHDLVLAFPQARCVRRSHYGATANLFTRREVFTAVGLLREDYGGDAEWGLRVHRAGRPVEYADDVVVEHPARQSLSALVARTRRGARELYAWRRHRPWLLARDQLKELVPPPDFIWKIVTSPVLTTPWDRARVLLVFVGLRYVRLVERTRLLLGAEPVR